MYKPATNFKPLGHIVVLGRKIPRDLLKKYQTSKTEVTAKNGLWDRGIGLCVSLITETGLFSFSGYRRSIQDN